MSQSSDTEENVVVIDNGSSKTKAGFGGDLEPTSVFPTLTAYPRENRNRVAYVETAKKDYNFIGEHAQSMRGVLSLKHPVEKGIITDWDEMTKIWSHVFHEQLRVVPEYTPVLLTEPALNPKANREKMVEIMLESFDVPACCVKSQPVLTLLASDKKTGVVFDSGESDTRIVPVHEGRVLSENVKMVDLAGEHLDQYLLKLLTEKGYSFTTFFEKLLVTDIKEKVCYTSVDFNSEMAASAASCDKIDQSYELPDGVEIIVGNERFRCPELFFQPSLSGYESPGIHTHLFNCIIGCDPILRNEFFGNIVLSGGPTKIPRFIDRLQREVTALAPSAHKVNVRFPLDRNFPSWIGGSLLASSPGFPGLCISKTEYEERGPHAIHEKCV